MTDQPPSVADRSAIRERVVDVLTQDPSDLVALVEDSAVVTRSIDRAAAAAIDREAASAREALRP